MGSHRILVIRHYSADLVGVEAPSQVLSRERLCEDKLFLLLYPVRQDNIRLERRIDLAITKFLA